VPESGAAEALAAARAFVARAGDALARLRLDVVLGVAPRTALRAALAPFQRENGAFIEVDAGSGAEDGSAARSSSARPGLAPTFAALTWLAEANDLAAPAAERVVAWLGEVQEDDGGWTPPPGSCSDGRLVLCGLLSGLLARTAFARPATLRRAGVLLAARWAPEQVRGGDFGMLAAYAGFFANTEHELSDAGLQWCGRELERGLRSGRLDALQVSRVLVLCDASILPGSRLERAALVRALLDAGAADGGWLALGAPGAARVEATVQAAVALRRLAPRGPGE